MSYANLGVPEGSVLQLQPDHALKYVEGMLRTSVAFRSLHEHFVKAGYTFYLERAKVFVYAGETPNGTATSVVGIVPSFVPVTSADPSHNAVGISIHSSGSALAVGVRVDHRPFGVTEFTLHEVDPKAEEVRSTSFGADELAETPVDQLIQKIHKLPLPEKADAKAGPQRAQFPTMLPGDQGLVVQAVVEQLLTDNYSRALFPPEYAQALNMQTPTFKKMALTINQRYEGARLGITICSCSSTSSNICSSTSSCGTVDI